ncbi:MAG TPA: hypothetical protein VFC21_12785, partial [Bryobacteraceae bacterium]|nr:hypothetical protein [Bryobacteraceae bacterium]
MRRWLTLCVLSLVSALWLAWAFPRLHPTARLRLRYGRDEFAALARRFAASHGLQLADRSSITKVETEIENQGLRMTLPHDVLVSTFPEARVETMFGTKADGAKASVDMRPDGRLLAWNLPRASVVSGVVSGVASGTPDAVVQADAAMRLIAGSDSPDYTVAGTGIPGKDGRNFRWRRTEVGVDMPEILFTAEVKDGNVWQAGSEFTVPPRIAGRLDSFRASRVIAISGWFLLIFAALFVAILREGSANSARAMKDRAAVWLSIAAGLAVGSAAFLEWDDQVAAAGVFSLTTELISLLFAAAAMGLICYAICSATILNARLHAGRSRGLRLLATRAIFSKTVGAELLAGWLLAPVLVAIPLLVSAILHQPALGDNYDGVLLNRFPLLDALLNSVGQENFAVLAMLGVMIPIAFRLFRNSFAQKSLAVFLALLTFAMIAVPFRGSWPVNLVYAALCGALIVWLYFRFGMLGAIACFGWARIV